MVMVVVFGGEVEGGRVNVEYIATYTIEYTTSFILSYILSYIVSRPTNQVCTVVYACIKELTPLHLHA